MENQVARRRISMIAGHFVPTDDLSASHVFPMNCSSSLNSAIRRCDNRMNFARQGSSSQGCFMRPVSTEQGSFPPQSGMPLKCSGSSNESSNTSQTPLFSTPARVEPNLSYLGSIQPLPQDFNKETEPAKFARPSQRISRSKQFQSKKKMHASEGIEWSPRMDVAESGHNYVVTVELPGASTNDIRVEINGQNLIVTGNRSTQWWKLTSCSNDSISAYHKREILQGPYQVVWTLPANANKDAVSAQFVDGFLQIIIPKL